jgi:predicted ATPase
VPKLGYYQKNEARRFITFIDAAYEAKTKVHFLAESEPEGLFGSDANEAIKREKQMLDVMHLEMMGDLLDELEKNQSRGVLNSKFSSSTLRSKIQFHICFSSSLVYKQKTKRPDYRNFQSSQVRMRNSPFTEPFLD